MTMSMESVYNINGVQLMLRGFNCCNGRMVDSSIVGGIVFMMISRHVGSDNESCPSLLLISYKHSLS